MKLINAVNFVLFVQNSYLHWYSFSEIGEIVNLSNPYLFFYHLFFSQSSQEWQFQRCSNLLFFKFLVGETCDLHKNSYFDDSSETDLGKIVAGVVGLIGQFLLFIQFPYSNISNEIWVITKEPDSEF